MATIQEILALTNQADVISELKKGRYTDQPDVEKAKKQLNPLKHDVMNPVIRQDKRVKVDAAANDETAVTVTNTSGEITSERTEKVARIAVALQRLIVKRAVAFTFGNEVRINAEPEGDSEQKVLEAVRRILKDNKSHSLNRKIARQVFSCCEAAELWFPVPVEKTVTGTSIVSKMKDVVSNLIGNKYHETYGFKSKFKLRSAIFSPLLGDALWPFFDETGDLVAFSREYSRVDENKTAHAFFETYTDTEHLLWEQTNAGWTLAEGYPKKIEIGKIPIVYAYQEAFEWQDVQALIDRLEKLLSNFADTNDYHASPKIFTKGEVRGFSKKGETGAIIEGDMESDAKYLAWEQAPESIKLEISTLLSLIYTLTQTPDISFDSVKELSSISGIALKLMFMDAHLKVKDKQEIFDEYLQRRLSVIKSFISKFNTSLAEACDSLELEPEITPYMIDDQQSLIEMLSTANGNKPLISRKLAAKLSGLAQDPDADYKQLEAESRGESYTAINEPTV